MAITTGALIAGAAVTAATAAGVSSYNAGRESRRASRLQRARMRLEEQRARSRAVRESRQALAESINLSEQQGLSGSSVQSGATADIVGQTNYNLSFLDRTGALTGRAQQKAIQSSQWQGAANIFSDLSALAGSYGKGGG